MKTARFVGNRMVAIEEKEKPSPSLGEAVVKVKSCGLCGSERGEYLNGFSHHQGHEISGVIDEIGEGVTNVKPGDRVVVFLTSFCGACEYCRAGMTTMCKSYPQKQNIGWASPGGFSEYLKINANQALPLDDSLSFDDGVLLLDTLGTPFHGLRMAHAESAASALVIGCGTVGLGAILILKALGVPRIFASDKSAFRLEKARKFGVRVIDANLEDAVETVKQETGIGADLVVEAAGNPYTLTQAINAVRFGGTVLCLGEQPDDFSLKIDLGMRLRDLTLLRSWYFPTKEYFENMELMKQGFFKRKEEMVTHCFPIEQMQEACDIFYSGGSVKTMIHFD